MTMVDTISPEARTATSPDGSKFWRLLGQLEGARDALTVSRAFGQPYELAGAAVIPVASVRGGGGGGGGEGTDPDSASAGSGGGMGFGMIVRPFGVYEVRDGSVTWRPAIDVMRLAVGGQDLAGIALFTIGRILTNRRR
jgi:Sporulation protein YtfJ (Spore_YtfJ)